MLLAGQGEEFEVELHRVRHATAFRACPIIWWYNHPAGGYLSARYDVSPESRVVCLDVDTSMNPLAPSLWRMCPQDNDGESGGILHGWDYEVEQDGSRHLIVSFSSIAEPDLDLLVAIVDIDLDWQLAQMLASAQILSMSDASSCIHLGDDPMDDSIVEYIPTVLSEGDVLEVLWELENETGVPIAWL
jgi:hypothetical protein